MEFLLELLLLVQSEQLLLELLRLRLVRLVRLRLVRLRLVRLRLVLKVKAVRLSLEGRSL